jgi:RNA polymerase sigma factor (sigma-70 family)
MCSESFAADFAEVYRGHQAALLREALRLTGNHDDAWDLVHDTVERAFRSFSSFRPGSNTSGWLITIMTRLFIDDWRRRRSRPAHGRVEDLAVAAPVPDESPVWSRFSGDDLQAALTELPAEHRALFERQAFQRETYAALAGQFRLKVATVGTRLLRTRARLRTALLRRRDNPSRDQGSAPQSALSRAAA